MKGKPKSAAPAVSEAAIAEQVEQAIEELRSLATAANLAGLARYAIPSDKALGVSMTSMKGLAKKLGRSHQLAAGLWATDIYDARMLATLVDEPALVTAEQMESWALDFDNWAICDTACFALFDRTSHAWSKVEEWASRREEFVKRAAFALLASLTVHDKKALDPPYLLGLELVEKEATDDRNFVKKAVNWALRSIGKRNPDLNEAAIKVAHRLADSADRAARWVGKNALKELEGPSVQRRIEAKKKRPG